MRISKISTRRQFLAEKKNAGRRVTIGYVGLSDLRSFVGSEYLSGMMKAVSDYDINFINMAGAVKYSLFDDMNFIGNYLKNFKFIKAPFLDGMVTWASSLWDFMDESRIVEVFSGFKPLPVVDIGHVVIPGATHIKIDSNSAIEDLMEHLVMDHKYTKFVYLGADVSEIHWNRLKTYQEQLKKYKIAEMDDSVYMAKSMNAGHIAEEVEKLLSNYEIRDKKNIDVIITPTDIIASEIIEQLDKKGISVPKDVAVTGFNNWYEAVSARSPLTTVDLSYFKRGYAAVEALIDRIIEPEKPTEIIRYPANLIIRQSCGCFEGSVKRSGEKDSSLKVWNGESADSEDEIRAHLLDGAKKIFIHETEESVIELLNCFFDDVYDVEKKDKMLLWFQTSLQHMRRRNDRSDLDSDFFHDEISKFRDLVLPFLENEDYKNVRKIEDIFHQMRTLISVYQKYDTIAGRENPYQMNNMSEQAISFVSAGSVENIFEILRLQLCQFEIPSAVIALSDKMTYSFPSPKISFIYPENSEKEEKYLGVQVSEPHLFPKEIFPQDRQYSMILKVLNHSDKYFGYAFFEMKDLNIATYDVLRSLLSNALHSAYKKNENVSEGSVFLSESQVEGLMRKEIPAKKSVRDRVTSEQIRNYLLHHIDEKTDIEKMAATFMVSKSCLSKKARDLTGLTIQSLHEKMKIEQAKNMLKSGNFSVHEISISLGFSNQNYFSNVFKKITGMSPRNWLEKNE